MRRFFGTALIFVGLSASALGSEPEIIITQKNSYNGYAFVAGRVTSKEKTPIGVTVEIGGTKFSTVSDPTGNWAVVFRHLAINFSVTAWNFEKPSDRIVELKEALPIE